MISNSNNMQPSNMDEGMDFSPHGNTELSLNDNDNISDQNQFTIPSTNSHRISDKKPQPKNKTNPSPDPNATPPATSETTTTTTAAAKATTSTSDHSLDRGNSMDSSSSSSSASGPVKRHTGSDNGRWEVIHQASSNDGPLGLGHFRLLKRLGYGDIGSVYLVELRGSAVRGAFFAMKVMDKASLVSRNKMVRAQREREILGLLDHPFLPTLYTHFETDKFYCLVMEYCSGGNLHSLRQRQPNNHFSESAARFYTSEVLLALEYLHMLGIVYRDLKPENVLVREEGHIMLSDFDLSLRCSVSPTLVKSSSTHTNTTGAAAAAGSPKDLTGAGDGVATQSCIQPSSFFPRILPRRSRKNSKSDFGLSGPAPAVEFNAEPTNARSMSFVGTHEYMAPEIIRGDGHGSAVDWWTFGIFLYELLHGTTPFKGAGIRATLCNVVEQPLQFPQGGPAGRAARDLIGGLLVKDPQKRIAFTRGATEVKQHPFFEGVDWALVRCVSPPSVPDPVDFRRFAAKENKASPESNAKPNNSYSCTNFEYF